MNKADAIPSMRTAETNALRAVERALGNQSGPLQYTKVPQEPFQEAFQQEAYQQDQYGKYQLKPQADPIDPVIAGLLTHLPPSGSVWPIEARKQWLELMEGSFKLIFKDKPAEPAP